MREKMRFLFIDILLPVVFFIVLYQIFQRVLFLIFPIFLAYLISEGIRKSLDHLKPLSPLAKRILTVLVLLILFSLLSLITVLLVERIIHYSTHFAGFLSKNIDTITEFCKEKIRNLEKMASSLLRRDMENSITLYLPEMFRKILTKLLDAIPSLLAGFVSFLPKFFISLLVFLLSCYYFSCDWKNISDFLSKKIPPEKQRAIHLGKRQFFRSFNQFIRAYAILFFISFSLLFLGLVLLKIPGAPGISLIIAFIDLLPVLGCGTVLIPWSLFCFFTGNTSLGIGILILHFVILLVHQLAEPRIVGSSIGLHPLLSLILVLLGLNLLGIWGMILFPLTAACLIHLKKEKEPNDGSSSFNHFSKA